MAAVTVSCHKNIFFLYYDKHIFSLHINMFLTLFCMTTDREGCHVCYLYDNRQSPLPCGFFFKDRPNILSHYWKWILIKQNFIRVPFLTIFHTENKCHHISFSELHCDVLLFSNRRENVLKSRKNHGTYLFSSFLHLLPAIRDQQNIVMYLWLFSINGDIYFVYGTLLELHFNA